jgi:hypothetical protein
MYIILCIYIQRENNTCELRQMVMPSLLKGKREIVGLARKITTRLLPRNVLRVDIYTREQVQTTKQGLLHITKAVGQLEKSGRALVFTPAKRKKL